ncbi:MAG: hypothetical protein R3C03_01935 [Pirellulaceae bacterium]
MSSQANEMQERVTSVREQVLQLESSLELNRQRHADFVSRIEVVRSNADRAANRLQELVSLRSETEQELTSATEQFESLANELIGLEAKLVANDDESQSLDRAVSDARNQESEIISLLKVIAAEISEAMVQLEIQRQAGRKLNDESERLNIAIEAAETQLASTRNELQQLQHRAEESDSALANAISRS